MSAPLASHAVVAAQVAAAEEAWKRGAWADALDAYNDILRDRLDALRDSGPIEVTLRAIDLVVVERLADLALLFGHARATDRLLDAYVTLAAGAGNGMAADYAALKRVHLALGEGRIDDAVARLEEMAPSIGLLDAIPCRGGGLRHWEVGHPWGTLAPGDRAVLFTRLYLELGRLMAAVGQYEDALGALERGRLHAAPAAPDLARRAAVALAIETASALLERGDLPAARERLDALGRDRDARVSADAAIRVAELGGKLAMLTGALGDARDRFTDALRQCRQHKFHQAAVRAALNLAHVLIYLNQTAAADELLQKAASESIAIDGDGALSARAAYLMSLARQRRASLAGEVAISPPVIRLWGRGGSAVSRVPVAEPSASEAPSAMPATTYLALFEDHAIEFHARLAAQGADAAARWLGTMHEVFRGTDSALIAVRLRALDALSAYYLGRPDDATGILEVVVPELERLGVHPELWQALRVLGWCRARVGGERPEVEALVERTQGILGALGQSLPDEDRVLFMLNKWTSEEEYIATRIDALMRERERVDASPWPVRPWRRWVLTKHVDKLLNSLDQYRRATQRRGLNAAVHDAGAPVALWRRLLLHPPRRAVVSFLVLPDRVFLACTRWGALDFGVSAVSRLEIREQVRRWHEAVQQEDRAADRTTGVADALASALQFPTLLDRLPRRIRALTVVPDDSLHGFPFAAMRHQGAYLIERFALSLGGERESWRRTSLATRGALLVGVSRGCGGFPPLPGVGPELDAVGQWLARRRVAPSRLCDEPADRAAVLDALAHHALAHVACHGVFAADRPDASGLVLIPGQGAQVELLSLRDLAQSDLGNLRHITLSACWSADNFVLPGRYVISLPNTLLRAGAESVLGSLWPVDDATAVALMLRFYAYLDRYPRDESLRRAQLDCLRSGEGEDGDPILSQPVSWAGFLLAGEPGRLS